MEEYQPTPQWSWGEHFQNKHIWRPWKLSPKANELTSIQEICCNIVGCNIRKREDMYTRSVSFFFVAISASQIPICCQRKAHRAASAPCSQSDGVISFLTQFPAPCCFKVKLCMYTVERQQGLLLLGIILAAEAFLACGIPESSIASHSFHNCDVLSCQGSSCWPLFRRPQRLECSVTLGILACSSTSCEDPCFWRSSMPSFNYCFCSYRRKQLLCNIIQNFNSSVHWQRLEIVAEITWKAASVFHKDIAMSVDRYLSGKKWRTRKLGRKSSEIRTDAKTWLSQPRAGLVLRSIR